MLSMRVIDSLAEPQCQSCETLGLIIESKILPKQIHTVFTAFVFLQGHEDNTLLFKTQHISDTKFGKTSWNSLRSTCLCLLSAHTLQFRLHTTALWDMT